MSEEIYAYYICDKCRAYHNHQGVWCGRCGTKLRCVKARASELEAQGLEDGVELSWYKHFGGRFQVLLRVDKTPELVKMWDGVNGAHFIEPSRPEDLHLIRVIVRAFRKQDAERIASKYGKVQRAFILRPEHPGEGPELNYE